MGLIMEALIIIDMQKGFFKNILGKREDRKFLKSLEPLPNETIFQKHVNSAFIGTNLENYLRDKSIDKLIIVGMTLPHCVSTTVRMASNLGFKVILIEDATITFEMKDYFSDKLLSADEIHRYHISALNKEFCEVTNTKEFLKA